MALTLSDKDHRARSKIIAAASIAGVSVGIWTAFTRTKTLASFFYIFFYIYYFCLPHLPCSRIACCEVPPVPFLYFGAWRSTGEDNRPSTVCACWDRIGGQGEVSWNEPLRLQLCAETIEYSADRSSTALRLIIVLFFKVAVFLHCSVTLPPQ